MLRRMLDIPPVHAPSLYDLSEEQAVRLFYATCAGI